MPTSKLIRLPLGRRGAGVMAGLAMLTAAGTAFAPIASAESEDQPPTGHVVVSGLDNPRGLTFLEDHLYVAEAGHGGPICLGPGPDGSQQCVGLTGAISRISHGFITHVLSGLISAAAPDGTGAEGMVAVSSRHDRLYGVFGGNTSLVPPNAPPSPIVTAARNELGQAIRVTGPGTFKAFAGVGDFDFAWSAQHTNLNPQFPDSNPNGILAAPGGAYVADAGANTLDWVSNSGKITVLQYFDVPSGAPSDAVPTCVAKGPDGALYVGELLGGFFAPGHARVWRVAGGKAAVWMTGFTTIQGCGFDDEGNFYATEFQTAGLGAKNPAGALVMVSEHGQRTVLGAGLLNVVSGFAARGDWVYVSNWSIMPASNNGGPTGQIVRFKTS